MLFQTSRLSAQYNPKRFKYWMSLHNGPPDKVLDMKYSPHVRFLNGKKASYIKMHQFYGKKPKWIKNKIKKFEALFKYIKAGNKVDPVIIKKNCEIYEGHHRVACYLVLGIKEIEVQIFK